MSFNLRRSDIPLFVRDFFGSDLPDGLEVKVTQTSDTGYEDAMRKAFDYIRRNGAGRYTSGTLMRILRAADTAEAARSGGLDIDGGAGIAPVLLTLGKPFRFDELTEVKTGGPVAMAVYFPEENGRLILAVHKDYRRKGFGKVLAGLVKIGGRNVITAWVNQRNAEGQMFLLSLGLQPTSMNSIGGICYTASVEAEGGEEDAPFDRLLATAGSTSARSRRRERY